MCLAELRSVVVMAVPDLGRPATAVPGEDITDILPVDVARAHPRSLAVDPDGVREVDVANDGTDGLHVRPQGNAGNIAVQLRVAQVETHTVPVVANEPEHGLRLEEAVADALSRRPVTGEEPRVRRHVLHQHVDAGGVESVHRIGE